MACIARMSELHSIRSTPTSLWGRFGFDAQLLSVIRIWLRDGRGFVVVGGAQSRQTRLRNVVFQGAAWGPSLWNAFFGGCVVAAHARGFDVVIRADDCDASKSFPRSVPTKNIFEDILQL